MDYIDYLELNKMLENLEIKNKPQQHNNLNTTQFKRDMHLNQNVPMNLEMANPQRLNNLNDSKKNKDDMNQQITNYNFIQKKKYQIDPTIEFRSN